MKKLRDKKQPAFSFPEKVVDAVRIHTGLTLFDSQLEAARAMAEGCIVQLPTGEGKTLAAVVTAALLAEQGEQVHILVFNDYLARRDYEANKTIFAHLNLTSGCITEDSARAERKAAYRRDVLYISAREAGFDMLRSFLATDPQEDLGQFFPTAIVDEADSILIDEACVPLVLAARETPEDTAEQPVWQAVAALPEKWVSWDRKKGTVFMADEGAVFLEQRLAVTNLFAPESNDLFSLVQAALEARFLLVKDEDYFIKEGTLHIVDQPTGRTALGRKFPDLQQRMVECKEGLARGAETVICNSTTMQFFLRGYQRLCGMTGTAKSAEKEIWQMYGRKVKVVEPHQPCIREDHPDRIFTSQSEKEKAVVAQIQKCVVKGQPVLLAAASLKETANYSRRLAAEGISHQVLDAKNDEREAALISLAGQPGQVTVSTNMAGRGVDIRLGGSDGAQRRQVVESGGLFVIGAYLNRSRRLDGQLRGRAGRQGDPGESRFFLSLDEPLIVQHLQERGIVLSGRETEKAVRGMVRMAQIRAEGRDAESRYSLERFAAVNEEHRRAVTEFRARLLCELKERPLTGPERAERQLYLYFTARHFADYLCVVENLRKGIHLVVIGGEDPLTEYKRQAAKIFSEMEADVRRDVAGYLKTADISKDGVNLKQEGLLMPASTWTYMIDESSGQFSRLPHMMKEMSNSMRGALFTISSLWEKIRERILT